MRWKHASGAAATGGGVAQNFGGMVWSTMSTVLFFNAISMLNGLPSAVHRLLLRLKMWWFPEIRVTIPEQGREWYMYNKVFTAVETYLGDMALARALLLKARTDRSGRNLVLSMDNGQQVGDVFVCGNGKKKTVPVTWGFYSRPVEVDKNIGQQMVKDEKKYYTLTLMAQHRAEVEEYIQHVMDVSREIEHRSRLRKLYTNSIGGERIWTSVVFKHPASFETLAMDPKKKEEIMDDLDMFSKSKDYYARIGKAWKRGYLLYGPPGTGKSTMIACMANYLDYDIYDLELTAVNDNTELRKLIVNTTSRSIIVVEDIDCSLQLTGIRSNGETEKKDKDEGHDKDKDKDKGETSKGLASKVTLSGLLNFIDGLWSASSGERLVVFTTNHVKKLDPALIRRGRMDMHIEMSYCDFESFKVLAKNYLGLEGHQTFEEIQRLLEEVKMSPADVAEKLMPKNIRAEDTSAGCLNDLVQALEEMKAVEEKRKEKVQEEEEENLT